MPHDTVDKPMAPGQGYHGELLLYRSDRRPPTLATLQRHRRHAAQGQPDRRLGDVVSGALRVGSDHIAARSTPVPGLCRGALPSLILFVTGQDSLGTVATTELVAVEVVRALCGSVGLIAAVPLTTVLAALVPTEAPPEVQAHPTGDGGAHRSRS